MKDNFGEYKDIVCFWKFRCTKTVWFVEKEQGFNKFKRLIKGCINDKEYLQISNYKSCLSKFDRILYILSIKRCYFAIFLIYKYLK